MIDDWTLLLATVGLLAVAVWLLAWSAFSMHARLTARLGALEAWRDDAQAGEDRVGAALTRPETEDIP